ncbi:hypothetical protein ACFL6G_02030 [candidate division KSB1 bacterium]
MCEDINIQEALDGLQSVNAADRDIHYFKLLAVSEKTPEKLYYAWDVLIELLGKPEVSKKFVAIQLLGNLIKVDKESRFENIFEDFYELLSHESPVVSPHIAGKSGKIIIANPHLKSKILSKLLNIDKISGCRHPVLIKAYIIEALDECYALLSDKERKDVSAFIQKQLDSESPKTRKRAKDYFKKRSL